MPECGERIYVFEQISRKLIGDNLSEAMNVTSSVPEYWKKEHVLQGMLKKIEDIGRAYEETRVANSIFKELQKKTVLEYIPNSLVAEDYTEKVLEDKKDVPANCCCIIS